jgi:EAL domain-containing protein (putative c-di-GMP-specific phosphodiesterase class I)
MPTTAIPLAEKAGLAGEIAEWVLRRACIDRKRWSEHRDGTVQMSVNMSAHQIMGPDFVSMVKGILAETDTNPALITIEITEGALISDAHRALVVLLELKNLGLRLALDDFGTGYSSLSYLKRFPIDVVKIDQSFITDLDRDRSSHAIVSKTIELAHLLGLTVVSEGVETGAQRQILAELRSDFCQGFYFGQPMSPDALSAVMGS